MSTLYHLIIAARTLDEGADYVRLELGAELVAGGKHATMGTHNRVLSLGGEAYLEVMAIDPDAAAPSHPRWISLDDPATQTLLRRGPALIHWVERTGDLEAEVRKSPDPLQIQSFSRGPYRWRMGLRADGALPSGGSRATLIQWDSAHPAANLP